MTAGFRKAASVLLVSLFTLTCPVMAADPSSGGDDDGGSISTTYIVIGIVVVLGGLLFLDVLSDSGDDASDESDENAGIVPTGVDWDEVVTTEAALVHVAVSTFPGENGTTLSREFIHILSTMVSDEIAVYSDPLDLGAGSAINRAGMANEYFGVDYLICRIDNESVFQFEAASSDSIVWTSPEQIDINIVGIIEDMLQADIF
ncbi:MAG: hypothetical protein KAQ97_07480 [Candidatus Fermentibacteraceae bacterium]|nr:hypothetical protein [Candidatus Fermentibacteraceae bacterium]